jgi:hypothetical protein
LHVSATGTGIEGLFELVLPPLARRGAHFKIAAGPEAIVHLNAGNFGEAQIGKVLTVYPRSDAEAVELARELIEHTRGIAGPRVATDMHLGASVYTRYGSMSPHRVYDRFGEPADLIPDGSGNWIPDLRPVPFSCPRGITIPFAAATAAPASLRSNTRTLLGGRYFVTDVLRPGLAGSVMRAIDVRHPGRAQAYVLKQARPHCCADELGRDRRTRLRHEGAVLARLRGLRGIARARDYFEDEEAGYLPVAYVPGRTLADLVQQLVSGRPWHQVRTQARRVLLQYAGQLVRRLRAAHARGVIHRDVAPGNVWIGDDNCVYLLDWECAHLVGSRVPAFRLATPGFSDLSRQPRAPRRRDDWQACGRVLVFMLTGLDPAPIVHGRPRALAARLATLTQMGDTALIELLSRTLTDQPGRELDAAALLRALTLALPRRTAARQHRSAPLFTMAAHESVLAAGFERLTADLRARLAQVRSRQMEGEATRLDVHAGIAGLLYVLAAAQRARLVHLDASLGERAAQLLTAGTPVTPDLPGLVHGRAGRALAVAAAVQAGCVRASDALRAPIAAALTGVLDWPDFTHGAAGQGFAALACARRLERPELAIGAAASAAYLVRTQTPEGAWRLPHGVAGMSGKCYTGFAHGAAGVMGFLGSYAALAGDAAADAAWRRAEAWLIRHARRGRGHRWHWPQDDTNREASHWWCHGGPGIALGWLCVAQAHGTAAIHQELLLGALGATALNLRSDSLGQCHGLAGVGEIYLQAHRVLGEECWRERAADIANVMVAIFRKRSAQPWQFPDQALADADGLMLGTAGVLHFLLRYHHQAVIASAPLLA